MLTRRDFLGTSLLAMGGLAIAEAIPEKARQPVPFRISLNVSTIRPYRLSVERQIEVCGKAGFDGIELWMSDIQAYIDSGGSLVDLAAKIKNNRLVLDNIIGFTQWAVDDQNRRDAGLQQMKREMEITAALGGKYIAAPMSGVNRLSSSLDDYAQRFLLVIEAGKSLGVTPLLELWGSGALCKLADAAHIAIATGHPDANLLLDFYHLYRGGNSFDSLKMINVTISAKVYQWFRSKVYHLFRTKVYQWFRSKMYQFFQIDFGDKNTKKYYSFLLKDSPFKSILMAFAANLSHIASAIVG